MALWGSFQSEAFERLQSPPMPCKRLVPQRPVCARSHAHQSSWAHWAPPAHGREGGWTTVPRPGKNLLHLQVETGILRRSYRLERVGWRWRVAGAWGANHWHFHSPRWAVNWSPLLDGYPPLPGYFIFRRLYYGVYKNGWPYWKKNTCQHYKMHWVFYEKCQHVQNWISYSSGQGKTNIVRTATPFIKIDPSLALLGPIRPPGPPGPWPPT